MPISRAQQNKISQGPQTTRKNFVQGSRRFSNYLWATITLLGGAGFILAGFSSYLKINLLPFAKPTDLSFIPQGVVMMFYGTLALSISVFIWLTIIWDIGAGYNEFNISSQTVSISRNGFPGKNRRILLIYALEDIQSVLIYIKEGLNPKRQVYLKLKNKVEVPLMRVGQPLSLSEIENYAIGLAKTLGVIVESK